MRMAFLIAGVFLGALVAAVPAHARQGGSDDRESAPQQWRLPPFSQAEEGAAATERRSLVAFRDGAQDHDRWGDRRPPPDDRRSERAEPRGARARADESEYRRLTVEERRDLRRDIRDAGRDIYERERRRNEGAGGPR